MGTKVYLDITEIKGEISAWMKEGINESDYIILIGTPRYKQRASQETNVKFEYERITEKLASSSNRALLLPLLYSGDFNTSFPEPVLKHLIRDFRRTENYHQYLLGLIKPLGMVPHIYPDLEEEQHYRQEYTWLLESFSQKIQSLEAEIVALKANQSSSLPLVPNDLPAASLYFVGREKAMSELKMYFSNQGMVVKGIRGMGGSGKSQLAAEFAHQSKTQAVPYRLIRWLKADSPENVKQSYFSLGEDLGIHRQDYKESEEAYKKAIDRQLLRYERILLIYDNVESLEDIEAYQPQSSEGASIHLLVTTRNELDLPLIMIHEFSNEEVQLYLEKRLGKAIDPSLAQQLGEELGYLTLAIVQASAYMVKYRKPLEDFIKLLKTNNRDKILSADSKLQSVASLWNVTLEKLSTKALEALQLCAHLDPDSIPSKLLQASMDENDSDEILYELRTHSLLLEVGDDNELFRMHRLLHESVRRSLSAETSKAFVEKAIFALKAIIYENRVQHIAEYQMFWKTREYLFTQIIYLIAQGESFNISPELLAALNEWAGDYHKFFTLNYDLGLQYYQKCYLLRSTLNSEPNPGLGNAIFNLASISHLKHDYSQSLEKYERCINIYTTVYGEKNPYVAASINNISGVHSAMGHFEEALHYYEKSLSIIRMIHGENHPLVALALSNVASGLIRKTQYNKALQYLEQSMAITKSFYCGKNHPSMISILSSIGEIYFTLGLYDKAMSYYEQRYALVKEFYGDKNHPESSAAIGDFGLVYQAQGQYDKAIEYFDKRIAISKAIFGEKNHPSIAVGLRFLGEVYKFKNQYDQALNFLEQSLSINKIIHGEKNHPEKGIIFNLMGEVYLGQGLQDKAMECFEQSLILFKAIYGDLNHPRILKTLNNIGSVYLRKSQYSEALSYFEQSLAKGKVIFAEMNHPILAKTLNYIGEVYQGQGQFDNAINYFEKSLAMAKAVFGEKNHPDVAQTLCNLGKVYQSKAQSAKALEYYEQCLMIRKQFFNDTHPDVKSISSLINEIQTLKQEHQTTPLAAASYMPSTLNQYHNLHHVDVELYSVSRKDDLSSSKDRKKGCCILQ